MESPRERIERLYREIDAGRADVVEEFYHPDYRDHTPSLLRSSEEGGREALARVFGLLQQAFPDTRHVLHDVIAEGDRVVVRLEAAGTHLGTLFGVAPSGRTFSQSGIVIYRLVDGKIVERWAQHSSDLLAELGVSSHQRGDGISSPGSRA
jgi:predicted ester cyclase